MLSVIIPVKNMEKYIEKAIKSIYNQKKVKHIEIIIVDFGSTDNTVKIVKKFQNNNQISIKVYENVGKDVVEARNFGLNIATCKYVSFIDADDWVDEEFFDLMIDKLEKESADIAICGFKYINEEDNKITYEQCFENETIKLDINNVNCFMNKVALGKINCEAWNKVYRKSFIDNSKIQFDNIYGVNGEDMLLNYLLYINFPKVVFEPQMLYYHLVRKNSLGKIKDINVSERLNYIIDKIGQYSKEKNIYNIIEESIAMQYLSFIIFQLTNTKLELKNKIKKYKDNIILKNNHKKYIKICIKSKYSNLKRRVISLLIYFKLDNIFILFLHFMQGGKK